MPANNMTERLVSLISSAGDQLPSDLRAALSDLKARLREPVRVAVVGPVKSGKSTIVNALLGQRIAPTDVSECTRVVSWFHYGRPQRIEVETRTGERHVAQMTPEGTLPRDLSVPVDSVRALHCYLTNEALRQVTLIDTPGIGSVHGEFSESTAELLARTSRTHDATGQADAVVFLFSQVMMADDLKALELFRHSPVGEAEKSAGNAVGVLSRADQLGDGPDAWQVALELANSYAGRFRENVATVVPVIGLLAESSETGALTETDANSIVQLAGMDEKAFGRLLWSVDRFVSADSPVAPEVRERLIGLLDLYGIRQAVELTRQGVVGATTLRARLSQLSGIQSIKSTLETYFQEQDHVLKARSALDAIERLTFEQTDPAYRPALEKLRSGLEDLRFDPIMHPVAELEAWHDCCTGRTPLPEPMRDEVGRLFRPGTAAGRLGIDSTDPDRLAEAAREGMVRWQKFMVTEATPAQTKLARVVRRTYQILWSELGEH